MAKQFGPVIVGPAVPRQIEHYVKTGRVWLRDYDLGIARTLGAVDDPMAPGTRKLLLTFPNLPDNSSDTGTANEGRSNRIAPVIFKDSEPSLQWNVFPRVVIMLDTHVPALQRMHPGTEEYMIPAPGATLASVPAPNPLDPPITGPTARETKYQTWPYDLTFTIEVWHRYRNWAQAMLFRIARVFQPWSQMSLLDSLGESRDYCVFAETAPVDLAEVLSMTDRGCGYGYTIRVEGELDLEEPLVIPTVRQINSTLHRLDVPNSNF